MHLDAVAPPGDQDYGVTDQSAGANHLADTDARFGMRFDVGATPLPVNKLRYYARVAGTYRVRIHRDSDDALMATADIVVASGEVDTWREEDVTEATLAASTRYTVSARNTTPATVDVYRNPSSVTYNALITVDSYRTGTGDGKPAGSVGATYWAADMGFLV